MSTDQLLLATDPAPSPLARPPVSTNRVMAYPLRPTTLDRNAYISHDDLNLLLGRVPDPRSAP